MSCVLKIGGYQFDFWKEIDIQRGIEQVAGQFSLTVADPTRSHADILAPGSAVIVQIDDETVCTGWLDTVTLGVDGHNSWLTVSGRDKTCDLVDCSAIFGSGQWKNRTLKQIATDLLAAYHIDLVIGDRAATAAAQKFASFAIEPGETVFAAIERAARQRALMVWGDSLGRVVIDLPGSTRAAIELVEGVNILYAQGAFAQAERFSHYTVKAHTKSDEDGEDVPVVAGSATDSAISRHRPLIVVAETHLSSDKAKERAQWEAAVRAGRGNRATVRVRGWRQNGSTGDLWRPGLRVGVRSDTLRANGDLLIASCHWLLSPSGGTTTELEIVDPRAFDQISGVRSSKLGSKASGKNGLAVESGTKQKAKKEDWGWL